MKLKRLKYEVIEWDKEKVLVKRDLRHIEAQIAEITA